jgi:hypothetical protein
MAARRRPQPPEGPQPQHLNRCPAGGLEGRICKRVDRGEGHRAGRPLGTAIHGDAVDGGEDEETEDEYGSWQGCEVPGGGDGGLRALIAARFL